MFEWGYPGYVPNILIVKPCFFIQRSLFWIGIPIFVNYHTLEWEYCVVTVWCSGTILILQNNFVYCCYLYFVSSREWPWCHRIFHKKTHLFVHKHESHNWFIKDCLTALSLVHLVTSHSFFRSDTYTYHNCCTSSGRLIQKTVTSPRTPKGRRSFSQRKTLVFPTSSKRNPRCTHNGLRFAAFLLGRACLCHGRSRGETRV